LTWFTLEGDDAKADDASRVSRNLSFKSNNVELGLPVHLIFSLMEIAIIEDLILMPMDLVA
jgi:hypothetical protein